MRGAGIDRHTMRGAGLVEGESGLRLVSERLCLKARLA
jgi:hypothetical protein